MNKVVKFYYKRDSLPHSEFQTKKSLTKFLEDSKGDYIIHTSTAIIFILVRAFCLKNKVDLVASYEDNLLTLDKYMRMADWDYCKDFNILDEDLETLLSEQI